MTVRVIQLEPDELPECWNRIAPYVAAACEESSGRYSPETVALAIVRGELRLWIAHRGNATLAFMLTRFVFYPTGLKTLEILACAGRERDAWQPYMAPICAWAKANGCGLVEAVARSGWERALRPYGFVRTHVLLEKKL